MTKRTLASNASLPSTTASTFPEDVGHTLAAVPETRGTPVVVLAPVTVEAPLPGGFIDIDTLIDQAEADPVTRAAIADGRKAIADNYYGAEPRSLAYFRLQKGWSQKQLATRVGTSQSYIARVEAGSIDPQVSTLRRLAEALDVQPGMLLDAVINGAKLP
jgi:DNA-binding XRE family transcriptional regulator